MWSRGEDVEVAAPMLRVGKDFLNDEATWEPLADMYKDVPAKVRAYLTRMAKSNARAREALGKLSGGL